MSVTTFRFVQVMIWPDVGWRVQWSIDKPDPSQETVVLRASGPEGPFEEKAVLPIGDLVFEDREVPYRSLWDLLYYKIIVRDSTSKATIAESTPTSVLELPGLNEVEIIRQHELLLYGVNGHPGYMPRKFACYKRTIDGTPCHFCLDHYTEEVIQDQCDVCKGTRYLEGWANPIKFNGRFVNQTQKSTTISYDGETEGDDRQLFTAAFPMLEPGDVLAEKKNGRRWRVLTITASEPNNVLVSQHANVKRIDRQFVENSLVYPGEA
jgi:hypothetical protein